MAWSFLFLSVKLSMNGQNTLSKMLLYINYGNVNNHRQFKLTGTVNKKRTNSGLSIYNVIVNKQRHCTQTVTLSIHRNSVYTLTMALSIKRNKLLHCRNTVLNNVY